MGRRAELSEQGVSLDGDVAGEFCDRGVVEPSECVDESRHMLDGACPGPPQPRRAIELPKAGLALRDLDGLVERGGLAQCCQRGKLPGWLGGDALAQRGERGGDFGKALAKIR